jgi:hypothetical protein
VFNGLLLVGIVAWTVTPHGSPSWWALLGGSVLGLLCHVLGIVVLSVVLWALHGERRAGQQILADIRARSAEGAAKS